ncbi:MarR family transcriptional regulator [Brevibacterium sp.]|uniref:MarR family winged helix-turn-helix transcriptional regulator n=1 Tax=Brevibacterium sp. TaxID=1701 RepID=UPI0028113CB7|nr:MarR family transcriptional regulator [Brevibacterium sp.]
MIQDNAALESRIGYQLKQVQSVLRSRMDEALRPLNLSMPQYACLELLRRTPGASNAELARGAFVTRQTMNTLLRGLEERGLVVRAERAESGRALPTTLTEAGEALLTQASERAMRIEAHMVSTLDTDQRKSLIRALEKCIDALLTP